MEGYIKLYRSVLDNPVVWKDTEYLAVWIFLLLNASHREMNMLYNGEKIVLLPGQLITGRKLIASKTGVSESKVQRILQRFVFEHQIEQQTSTRSRIITICNWNQYQQIEPAKQDKTRKAEKPVKQIVKTEFESDSFEMRCVDRLIQSCVAQFPNSKIPQTQKEKCAWCSYIEKMIRLDGRTEDEIMEAITFAVSDEFWKPNIRSTKKLREKFETLIVQARRKKEKSPEKTKNRFMNFEQRDTNYDSLVLDQMKSWINNDKGSD